MSEFDQNTAMERFKSFLKSDGLKLTKERLAIFEEALATEGHFEADDLLVILQTKRQKTSRATVYRTLDIITRAGILYKVYFSDSAIQFEKVTDEPRHDHLICQRCGKKIEFSLPELPELQKKLCEKHNFTMKDYSFQILGICADCIDDPSSDKTIDI